MPPKGRSRLRANLKSALSLSKTFSFSPCLKGLRSCVTCQQSRWVTGRKTRQMVARQFPTPFCAPILFDFLLTRFARRLPITKAKRRRAFSNTVKKFFGEREFLPAVITPSGHKQPFTFATLPVIALTCEYLPPSLSTAQ